jgi:hypothetical protein
MRMRYVTFDMRIELNRDAVSSRSLLIDAQKKLNAYATMNVNKIRSDAKWYLGIRSSNQAAREIAENK